MGTKKVAAFLAALILLAFEGFGQDAPVPAATPAPKLSELLAKNVEPPSFAKAVSKEKREKAYAKLMEGQRYVWSSGRLRSRTGIATTSRLARQSFVEAVELNPALAEGYTALAELAINSDARDIDEAIALATLATRARNDSFGARRILARLYTYKSKLNTRTIDQIFAEKAVSEWRHVARMDPRNAEAWAFLSDFYEKLDRQAERIEALQKWLASAPAVDTQFYRGYMGGDANLSPEGASLKLGLAMLKVGRTREAVETLSLVIAEDPDNYLAVDYLREALDNAPNETAAIAADALRQAVFVNSNNISLITLLARVYTRAGKPDEAAKLLRNSSLRLVTSDRGAAASLQIALGDVLAGSDKTTEAIAAYEEALKLRGVAETGSLASDQREFAIHVFEKMIQAYKAANLPLEVRTVIERTRRLLGKDDLFADRQLISYLRETGKKQEALAAARVAREKSPADYSLVRLEATLLTENGRVDEAVASVRKLMQAKSLAAPGRLPAAAPDGTISLSVPMFDDFSNYLFISNLYSQAGRGKEAADAANEAYLAARGTERKQIAKLTLATAQQVAGDAAAAEATLRAILKESPGNPIALNNLGYFLLERNERFDEALEMIQQAVKIDPTNPSFLDSLGWAYFKLGRLDEAERELKEAARFDSSSATIQEHLGDVYQKQGRADLARAAWERALNIASDSSDVSRLKAKLGVKVAK